ncbi:hypothetical protein OHD05_04990 [Escherichia coli]|uniref:hypothetical protein n=1 Tax=Escherichia coli TaxID=562 RepID=UPI002238B5B8|nr:hypothetical protein [Escherichia coli]MCW7306514.1 hypothetical protein [Escherichia coli]
MGRDEFCRAIISLPKYDVGETRPAISPLAVKGKAIKISKTPSSMAFISMHNSAQICTIFFERLFALPARVAAGSVKDPCVHKNALFLRAGDGEQPAFQGVNSIP